MQEFDFDAIDRLEQNALAAKQTTNGAQINQQFAPPQSYPAYQPPNNALTNSYYQPPNQQGWNGGVQPTPWQQQQQQWQPPPVAAPHGGQQPPPPYPHQQPYQGHNNAQNTVQPTFNGNHQQNQQQYGWQQHAAPPPPPQQPGYYNHHQQQQWNPCHPQQQGYGYPPPAPQQQHQQQGNAWQPVQRPSVWQRTHPLLPAAVNNNDPVSNQQQQQLGQSNIGGAGQGYHGSGAAAIDQKAQRKPPPQQQQQGGKVTVNAPTDRAQKDLFSLWGVQKQPQASTSNSTYQARTSNMPPPLPLTTLARQQQQAAPPGPLPNTSSTAAPAVPYTTTTNTSNNNNGIRNTTAAVGTRIALPGAGTAGQLTESATLTGCLKVNAEAAQHWIYPLGVPEREYQLSAISTALLQNTLVCLPTGLGKTLIAAVVMFNFCRWFPESKVVFVAPTKPLVSQQIEACRRFMGLSIEATAELTGRIKAEERKALWQDADRRVFFCTPQTFFNDVKLGVCPYDAVSCVVVDECHRCTGQSEIAQTLRLMRQKYKLKFRVLGLSATPGSSADHVQEVLTNLGATAVYFRSEEDPDVVPYVHKKNTELVVVEPESEQSNPRTLLLAVLQRLVGHLAGARFYFGPATAERVTRINLINAQNAAKEAAAAGSGGVPSVQAQEWFRQATVLTDIRDSLDKYGVLPTAALVRTKLNEERCIKTLHAKETTFAHFVTKLEASAGAGGGGPRLARLVDILRQHFEGDGNPGGVIVFASLREGVQSIVDALKQHEPLIRARSFVGQGNGSGSGWAGGGRSTSGGGGGRSKSGGTGGGGPGMNQKEQKEAIKGFFNGLYNVLVATCIGEEGLDIPAVDLIVCYDATASPTRAVQRRGRTGRHREGRVVYLLGAGREEEHYHRIKEATTQLHGQLRQAERYFELVLPGPRMLPRQYNPEKIDVDSGFINSIAAMDIDGAGGATTTAGGRGGRGRGRGSRGGGGGRGRGRGDAAPGVSAAAALAMLEAGAIRLAEHGPRYVQAPTSPLPSQSGVTQFESPAGPHQLLFPETSSAFIRSGSNGRRLAIAPPPSLEVLMASTTITTEEAGGGGDGGAEQTKVPTPQQSRRLRFLPELGDDVSINLPCGRILGLQKEGESQQQQPAWAFLAAAIARPLQPQLEAAVNAANAGPSKKRKPTRTRKAPQTAIVHRPTPPAAVLNLAGVADVVGQEHAEQGPPPPAAAAPVLPVNNDVENMEIDQLEVVEEEEPEVINLVSSEEEQQQQQQQPAAATAATGDDNGAPAAEKADELFDDDNEDIIQSSSQRRDGHHAPTTTTTAPRNSQPIVAARKSQEEEEHIPLAKRMRMLRESKHTTTITPGSLPNSSGSIPGLLAPLSSKETSRPMIQPTSRALINSVGAATGGATGSIGARPNGSNATVGGGSGNGNGSGGILDDYYYHYEDDGNFLYDDYNNCGFEEDEQWEEWQDDEAIAAAAEVEREREEKEEQQLQLQRGGGGGGGGGPRRRNIIMSQSPGSTQPLGVSAAAVVVIQHQQQQQHPIGSDNSSLPFAPMGQPVSPSSLPEQRHGEEQNRGLTRLRKAGNAAEPTNDRKQGQVGNGTAGGNSNRAVQRQQQQQQQRQRPRPRQRGPFWAGASRFIDTEAQLSGDDSDGNEEGDLDGYESDFINDGTQDATGGTADGGGSLATPRDHASLAAFHHRRLHEENSPSPASLLRRLQQARFGRRGVPGTPSTAGHAGGLCAPYGSDDYDREDSFIDDGEDDDEGFDTPVGRGSHVDACGGCGKGGQLLLCDTCPSAFHLKCVGLTSVPVGDWFCPVCVDSNTPALDHLPSGGGNHRKPAAAAPAGVGGVGNVSNRGKAIQQRKPKTCPPPRPRPPAAGAQHPPRAAAPAPRATRPVQAAKPPAATATKHALLASDSDDDFA
jgi:ERCC4-related helicase